MAPDPDYSYSAKPGHDSPGDILAIDPGISKVGLAILGPDGAVKLKKSIPTVKLFTELESILQTFSPAPIIVGNRTGSSSVKKDLSALAPDIEVIDVDEHRSSEEARKRYWIENPPRGWRKFIPTSLQTPPRPYDDAVAVILGERYLQSLLR